MLRAPRRSDVKADRNIEKLAVKYFNYFLIRKLKRK